MAEARTAHPEASSSTRSANVRYSLAHRSLAALAVSTALICQPLLTQPLAAQSRDTVPELEELIPDEAIENPEAWVEQALPPEATAQEQLPELEPDSPLADMPLVTVPWPDEIEVPEFEPLEPEEDIEFVEFEEPENVLADGDEVVISDELTLVFPSDMSLFPERDEFLTRFESLSTIEELEDNDNAARLAAQANADEDLLRRLLRIYGYYDAQVIRTVGAITPGEETSAAASRVRFDIIPGPQYAIGAIDLGDLQNAGDDYAMLRETFEVWPGDPVLQDKIEEEQFDLDRALGEGGYPFAEIDAPELLIDHARDEGDLTMPVRPMGKYVFGSVRSNMPEFLSGEHLADIARFEPGELYQRSLELDLRRALQATGLVASTTLTPIEVEPPSGDEPGVVDIGVEMTEAPLRTLRGSLGYGTGEGARLEASWEHRNLFPPEGMLRVRGIVGTQEQLAGVTFRKNNWHGRDRILTIDAFASTIDYTAYDARTLSLVGKYERVSTLLFQKPFNWSMGFEAVATQEREADAEGNFGPRQTFFVGAIPGYAQLDTTNDLLDPKNGFRLALRLSPEISKRNDRDMAYYVRGQVDASYYRSVTEKIVVAGRARFASIPGAQIVDIAPSRRLYAGGGSSVRGYGYREIGPENALGDPTGGRSLAEFSLEARVRTGLLGGAVGVVPFIDAGTVGTGPTPSFDDIKFGAGIGVRYHTGFGPVRVDVAVPLNPGPNDGSFAVYVSLGQAF